MNKKKIIIIILALSILFGIYTLYNTFAVSTIASNNSDNVYNIIAGEGTTITVPKNSSKTIYFHLKNTNNGSVKYAVGYNTAANIEVKVYEDSKDKVLDIIGYGENKFIKLYLNNTSSADNTITIKSILGYENGGDLIIPDDITLITEVYSRPPSNLVKYITWLYTNATKATVENNSIKYNYATDVSLMNDRLGGTTTDLDGGNIRYYGTNPNNYIYFNCSDYSNQTSDTCEKWRIIGVFDGRVKIMRNEQIGKYSWDSSASGVNSGYGINEWSQADLMKLLNPGYETESVGGSLYYNSKSGTCYNGVRNATTSCDFTSTGIKNDETRGKIAEVTWNLGGRISASIYSNQIYGYERGTIVVSNPIDGITRTTVWIGKVALPYPSDYGYAVDFDKCSENLNNYGNSTCTSNNWMKSIFDTSSMGWLLTPKSNSDWVVWYVDSSGYVNGGINGGDYLAYFAFGVAPVLYLGSDESIESGDGTIGTEDNPFKLNP